MTETKLIALLLGIVIFLGALFFGFRAVYDAGDNAGAARIQTAWDENKAAIQKVTDDAIAAATKERDSALQANEAIQNDYQIKLSAANANAADFAKRMQNAIANLAANRGSNAQAGSGSGAAATGQTTSADQLRELAGLTANLHAECVANADQLDGLIAEIKPQLGVP